jgi:pyridoxamine 5'-phosphate oxidase-like protein
MKAPEGTARIDDELKAFLESGPSVIVGTRDLGLAPEITRAWGPRVSEDRRSVSVCVPLPTSAKTLDNLADNGRIALACALPTTVKSVQLKGTCIETSEPDAADLAAVEEHREVFAARNERIGVPRHMVETLWRRELETSPVLVKIRFVPEQAFDQTPGPDTGSPR